MVWRSRWSRSLLGVTVVALAAVPTLLAAPAQSARVGPQQDTTERAGVPVPVPTVTGPLPGAVPGDPADPDVAGTYPWMSTDVDLTAAGYVEEEFTVSGAADGYGAAGEVVASDVPYRTRIIVRRPAHPAAFNGTVLAEWQNVTAGHDLDALWSPEQIMRDGYAWVGVSAQRVGVDQLRGWSPARYGELDVTGAGRYTADELSYDVFAQIGKALAEGRRGGPLGALRARTVLAIGASQSASRLTTYYDAVLPQTEPVFDGFSFVVGPAPARQGTEPVFHVLSETDVRSAVRRPDDDGYRRWEVAGTAHSGWQGQQYRRSILERDLGAAPTYDCARPPFSRVPLHHVIGAAHAHLARWARHGVQPPSAPALELHADGTKVRDELGLAVGGIRLSQVEVPTALNTGDNAGQTFCFLFGTHVPFGAEQLAELYPSHGGYVSDVVRTDRAAVRSGYLLPADARQNLREAARSGVGRR